MFNALQVMGLTYLPELTIISSGKLAYVCSCGNEHLASIGNIRQMFKTGNGKCCPKCRKKDPPNKLSEAIVMLACSEYGWTYLNGYRNADLPFQAICPCGNSTITYLGNIRAGKKCLYCSGNTKYTQEQMQLLLQTFDLELISAYHGALQPVRYICACGGIGFSTWANIQNGKRCGNCAEHNWRKAFAEANCEILVYNTAKKITYRCSCGELNTCASDYWKEHKDCPKCHVHGNFKPNKCQKTHRPGLNNWKRAVLQRDAFTCQGCQNTEDLQCHHIEAWSIKPELEAEVTNGLTLCRTCHSALHSKYGINVGRRNIIKEGLCLTI